MKLMDLSVVDKRVKTKAEIIIILLVGLFERNADIVAAPLIFYDTITVHLLVHPKNV